MTGSATQRRASAQTNVKSILCKFRCTQHRTMERTDNIMRSIICMCDSQLLDVVNNTIAHKHKLKWPRISGRTDNSASNFRFDHNRNAFQIVDWAANAFVYVSGRASVRVCVSIFAVRNNWSASVQIDTCNFIQLVRERTQTDRQTDGRTELCNRPASTVNAIERSLRTNRKYSLSSMCVPNVLKSDAYLLPFLRRRFVA